MVDKIRSVRRSGSDENGLYILFYTLLNVKYAANAGHVGLNGMEDNTQKDSCTPLPLAALQLLVPPIRLVSAAIWQTVQQKVVADYGMLAEFVSMVTAIVPELLTTRQRAQLILGLRARLILEICQFEATADFGLVQPHLERVQLLTEAWVMEAGAEHMEAPQFVDLVKKLLKNPDERKHFFQNVFPEEFGPTYDEALHTLMWMFLSRLEQFLPLQTFQQVASMFGGMSSVLKECVESVSHCEELKTLLHYQKDLSQLDHNDASLDGTCIISALKLASEEKTKTGKPQANIMENVPSRTSDVDNGSLTSSPDATPECPTSEIKADENGTEVTSGGKTRREENAPLKRCSVQLQRLEMPLSLGSRPVRRNRGMRMKKILLQEERSLCSSRKAKPSKKALLHVPDDEESNSASKDDDTYLAPLDDCSDADSWSYYSDDSSHKTSSRSHSIADSWSNYSDDEPPFTTPLSSFTEGDLLPSSSNKDPSFTKNLLAASRKPVMSNIKVSVPKKSRTIQCFICNEPVNTGLRRHMKIHFPTDDYACPHCDSRFKLYSSLRLHLNRTCFQFNRQRVDPEKLAKAKKLYSCDECDEAFKYKVSLERHKMTHNELYCNVCRKVLRDAAVLARHKASHTLFQCNRCEETFTLFMPLIKHYKNVHKISKPFKCNHCPRVVSSLPILIAHEWKHTGHLPFQCAQCSARFRSDADLSSHQRVHTRERPYLCAECGKTFSHRSNMLRHLTYVHSESRDEKKYSCSACEKSFKERGTLKKHQRIKHLNELFRHPCPDCGKMLSESTIARHKLIHTGEKPFKCTEPDCDKYFRSTSEVKNHGLIQHTTERPFKCDVCGKGFIKMCHLKTHDKIHSGEKPFVCNFCGKSFPKRYSMQRHKTLVHTFVKHKSINVSIKA